MTDAVVDWKQQQAMTSDELMILAAQKASIFDICMGVVWFLIIALMFLAQHHTCDAYFVPAINVFVDKMRSSPNKWLQRWGEESVAGATICALGCNGPELFSNLISLYTGSDAGIGVVVGSEIFNLLVIVGCSTLAAPMTPLPLERLSFTRDCIAYAVSIILLYWALQDKQIDYNESRGLLACAVVYVTAVYFTKDFESKGDNHEGNGTTKSKASELTMGAQPSFKVTKDSQPSKIVQKHSAALHGIEVEVEEIFHGRMVDGHHGTSLTQVLDASSEDGLRIDATKGFQLTSTCDESQATLLGPCIPYSSLKEVTVMGEGIIELEFEKAFMAGLLLEHITLKLSCATSGDRDRLLNLISQHNGRAWVHGYDSSVAGGYAHFKHEMADPDLGLFLKAFYVVPHFLIDSCLRATLSSVDIKDITKENRWPLCFAGAMCWLAFFSYCMLMCCNWIHYFLPVIPTAFLGITVCAVGTSFPNAVASVILSSQNKPAASIANALGSNIQNVFLAMAFPWVFYSTQTGIHTITMNVAGIQEGVCWMVGTLALLLFFVFTPPCCKLTKLSGYVLNSIYAIYVIITCGETFGWWPPLIK